MDVSKYSVIYKKLLENLSRSKDDKKNTYVKKSFNQLTHSIGDKMTSFGIRKVDHIVNSAITAVNEIGLGRTSVTALFLYHTISNSDLDIDDIASDYNENTVTIAKGMLKISAIGEASKSSQAENYRRLIISLAKDVRVILIRIAEQLELMRSSKEMPGEEQIIVASEASYLYAPLAHRLGLYLIKSEMEDLSLKYTDKNTYQLIAKKLDETMVARKAFIADFIKPIRSKLESMGFKFEIKGRPKSIHSIWNKMHNKGVAFEDIYDLFAIRIIIDSDLKALLGESVYLVEE
ncbi:MAG: HD domain-containing protein [Bacteroidales bacterium]|nr:HD domain-containing protein [Bacteroidales bacterium]